MVRRGLNPAAWLVLCSSLACGRTGLRTDHGSVRSSDSGGASHSAIGDSGGRAGDSGDSGGRAGDSGGRAGDSGGRAGAGGAVDATTTIVLEASNDRADRVRLQWTLTNAEIGARGFELARDGVTVAELPSGARSYDDLTAEAGTWSAPDGLTASQGSRADGVELSWMGSKATHRAYRYQLFADNGGASNQPLGSRAAPELLGYDVRRDAGGSWEQQGLETHYLDLAAPLGLLRAPAEAMPRAERDYVRLSVTNGPFLTPTLAVYQVRARSASGPSAASEPASGYRAFGPAISYQWQESRADSDAGYADLNDVTGALWFTPAKIANGRYYRARMSSEGASGFSDAVRAELAGFTRLSAGAFQTCGQRLDGTVSCWGEERGPGNTVLASFSAAPGGGCGVRADGKRVCWGYSVNGKTILPPDPSVESFRSVSAGLEASCGILLDDTIACWGTGSVRLPPSGRFKSLSVGRRHACAIELDDRVQCWGHDEYGQAPPGPSTDQFKQVRASWGDHSCGIRLDDRVLCWGRDDSGQAPTEASAATFRSISAGVYASCGIRSDGKLVCWGQDYEGHAPSGPSDEEFVDVAMGYFHTCALRMDGGVRCWGDDSHGQIPYVPPTTTFRSVAIAMDAVAPHACGIRTDGKLVCWGDNELGQAPPGPSDDEYLQIDAAARRTCALRSDGRLVCWGYADPADPPPGPSLEVYASLSVGGKTCACGPNAPTKCWTSESGLGLPNLGRVISANSHACALDLQGQLRCEEYDDPLGYRPAPSNEEFLAVSVGAFHTCALRRDHTLACWGRLGGPNAPAREWPAGTFQSIDSASDMICGVQLDGKLVCRGGYDDTFPSRSLDSFRSVSVGRAHFCAVREDGHVLCLGEPEGM